jgi:antitoxin ParD1/3/4
MVNFEPTPEQQRFIEASVRSGRFRDVNEVLREGLELLKAHEASQRRRYEAWLADTRQKIQEGLDELERGEWVDGEEVFRRMHERIEEHRRRELESREKPKP